MTAMEMVIGLEVHVQLATRSKLFCGCATNSFGKPANTSVCPVCTGQPGALPALNRRAVELAFAAALALECRLAERSIFARKNYFYPDLPKGYQISQYEAPFSTCGRLELPGRSVRIARIHIEEDAGKLLHAAGSRELEHTLVDFNRAGTPLIEIVSEPDMRAADEAFRYLSALKSVLRYCGVSNCDMEKGELRCDANISVRAAGSSELGAGVLHSPGAAGLEGSSAALGVKVEIKNLNSFHFVREALGYEFDRQSGLIAEGGTVAQETRLWDSGARRTEPMRSKEDAHDYRYFPEPDLVPLVCDARWREAVRARLPELPEMRKARFRTQYGLSEYDAGVLTAERPLADFYESVINEGGGAAPKAASNWVQSVLLAKLNEEHIDIADSRVPPGRLGELIVLVERGTISGLAGKDLFLKMWETGKAPGALVAELGLEQVSDAAGLARWVDEALAENPGAAADVKAGKEKAIGRLIGAVMKKSSGKANPGLVDKLIKEILL